MTREPGDRTLVEAGMEAIQRCTNAFVSSTEPARHGTRVGRCPWISTRSVGLSRRVRIKTSTRRAERLLKKCHALLGESEVCCARQLLQKEAGKVDRVKYRQVPQGDFQIGGWNTRRKGEGPPFCEPVRLGQTSSEERMGGGHGRAATSQGWPPCNLTVGGSCCANGNGRYWHDISVAHQRTAPASGRLREKSSNALTQPTIICVLLVLNPLPPTRTHCTATARTIGRAT